MNDPAPQAAILAGGRSSRMGRDKVLIPVDGVPMIARIIGTLKAVFEKVFIVADDAAKYGEFGVRVIPDLVRDSGPLGGIHAALTAAAPAPVFVMPCDMPFLPPDLVKELITTESTSPVRVLWDGTRQYPLCGFYQQSVLPAIAARLEGRQLRMSDLLGEVGTELINPLKDPRFHAGMLINVNTPEDLSARGL